METPGWPPWLWLLYGVGAVYFGAFAYHFALFARLEARARRDGGAAIARYNRSLRGFPNAFFAKMLGRLPLEGGVAEAGRREPGQETQAR